MTTFHPLAIFALGAVLATPAAEAQDRAQYRDFHLTGDLASVATLAGIDASRAKVIHQRPAVLQELEWRPTHWLSGTSTAKTDPVEHIVFSFYNDRLFKIVVNYDRQRTEGLTDADIIEAVSRAYGTPLLSSSKRPSAAASIIETESATPLSRWGGEEYAVALYRTSYSTALRLIVTSPELEAQANAAVAEALRLDEREAPQREIERRKKEANDTQASQEKARLTNKPTFRP
jgi:hypothetical protein